MLVLVTADPLTDCTWNHHSVAPLVPVPLTGYGMTSVSAKLQYAANTTHLFENVIEKFPPADVVLEPEYESIPFLAPFMYIPPGAVTETTFVEALRPIATGAEPICQ